MDPIQSPIALILEDDEAFAETLRTILKDLGLDSAWSRTVEEARVIVETRAVAIVIVDLELGEHRGRHLLDDLATLPQAPPMLVVSGAADAAAIAKEFGLACVKKPFELEMLAAAIAVTRGFEVKPGRRARSGTLHAVSHDDPSELEPRPDTDPKKKG